MTEVDDLLEQQRRHFNSIAQQYHRSRSEPKQCYLRAKIWESGLRSLLRLRSGAEKLKVLEAMCGFADSYEQLQLLLGNVDYTGFDYSDEVVRYLREFKPEVAVSHLDVTKYQAEKEEYDLVIVIGGLHHVPHHSGVVIRALAKSLNEGGYFVSFEPTSGNSMFKWIRSIIYKRNRLFDADSERAFELEELESKFQDAGLKSVDKVYPGLLAYILFYNPDAFPFLNVGGLWLVKCAWWLDKWFLRTRLARVLSFATFTVWQKTR